MTVRPASTVSPAVRQQIESIRVAYPRWQGIVEEIGRCQEWGPVAAEPPCLLVVGPTGTGKSTLVETYAREHPAVLTESGITYPVVRATIPTPATIKALAMVLLAALGDPRATSGTVGSMTYRLTRYFRDCKVELLILDEVQHFRDRDSRRVLENASNWLKTLIKETGVACVLVGLQGEAEEVVGLNPQLARLFGAPHVLLPFVWDERRPETVQEFVSFLALVERALPLAERPELAELGMARRLHGASGGVMAYLMELVRGATYLALTEGRATLDREVLGRAFAQRLASVRRGTANPFRDADDAGGLRSTRVRASGTRETHRRPRAWSTQDGGEVVATPAVAGAAGAWERGPVPRLINRLRPAPLESLGSLLERLRVANHYRERRWLGGLLARHPERPEVVRRVRDFEVLAALTGLSQEALIGLTLHRFAPWYGVDRHLGRPLPAGVDYLSGPLWPDIGGDGNTREGAAVCPGCWGERAVILLPWWLHHVTACPWHGVLLRERCAGCAAPLRLAAGREGCEQCGAAIAAMATRSLAGDADGVELSALVWRATGCVERPYPPEGLTRAADHLVRGLGTPALLRGLWGGAQAEVTRDGGPRLHEREIGAVHEALVAGWRRRRDGAGQGGRRESFIPRVAGGSDIAHTITSHDA